MIEVLAAAVTATRARQANRPCQFCKAGFHERCIGAYVTPSGEHACVCAYGWRHAEIPNLTRRSQ